MLRIISCHGKVHERGMVGDFIAIVEVRQEELKQRPLTGTEVMMHAVTPRIATLTCFGENEALTSLANKIYPILKHMEGEEAAITLLQRIIQGSIDLSHQPRQPAFSEQEPEQQAAA